MLNRYKSLIFVYLLLFIFLEIAILSSLFKYSFVFLDDVGTTLVNLKKLFSLPETGIYVSTVICRFFNNFLPELLNVHPSFFKANYFCYIEAGIFVIFSLILTNFIYLKRKINIFYPLSFVFISSLIFIFLQQQPILLLFVYEGLFRMFLPPFFMILIFYFLIKNVNEPNLKNQIFIFLFIFLSCISNEFMFISTITGYILYFLVSKYKNNEKNYINIVVGLFISILSGIFLYKIGGLTRHVPLDIFSLQYILEIIKLVPSFCMDYLKYILLDHYIMYLILIIQIITLLRFNCEKYNRVKMETIKIVICFLFGILLFFASSIVLGRTHDDERNFWLIHQDFHVMYNVLFCSLNLMLLNLIIRFKLVKEYIIGVVFFVLTILFIYSNYNRYTNLLREQVIPYRLNTYKVEKIIKLANLRNKTALLPNTLCEDLNNWALWDKDGNKEENVKYKESAYITFLNSIKLNRKIEVDFMFVEEEKAMKEFNDNGGIFTQEELININFQMLTDENFIENNQ